MKLLNKSTIAISTILFLLSSCQLSDPKEGTTSTTPPGTQNESTDLEEIGTEKLPYTILYNTENDHFEIIENSDIIPTNEEEIIQALNTKYPEIKVEVEKKSNDTLYVNIPDATYLTQSIGTTGASSYLIEATYGFTSLQGLKVVNFSFDEGDHAVPGPYTRESFTEFFE